MRHKIYSYRGIYKRTEDLDLAKIPLIPKAMDGFFTAYPELPIPAEYDKTLHDLNHDRIGGWSLVPVSQEETDARVTAQAELNDQVAEKAAVAKAFKQFQLIIDAGSLSDANQTAAIQLLTKAVGRLAKDLGYAPEPKLMPEPEIP